VPPGRRRARTRRSLCCTVLLTSDVDPVPKEPRPVPNGTPVLQRFAEDIWIADDPSVRFIFVPLPIRMIVVKLGGGLLWINPPLRHHAKHAARSRRLVGFGISGLLQRFRFGGLSSGTRCFIERSCGDLRRFRVGLLISHLPASYRTLRRQRGLGIWKQLVFKGNLVIEEVAFLHKKSRTLIVKDYIGPKTAASWATS
jgi:hypothetical protein